jgi:uncharacterized OsmC-like protein
MSKSATDLVKQRQEPLRQRYRAEPGEAQITDRARAGNVGADPFHGVVMAGDGAAPLDFGIHRAVGGDHDLPNPGDLLCAALAACLDSTLRMIAARIGVELEALEVEVRAVADVRGCLMVDRDVPAGFQRIDVDVLIGADGADPARIRTLTSAAERCCVVLQTLRGAVPVATRFREPPAGVAAEPPTRAQRTEARASGGATHSEDTPCRSN